MAEQTQTTELASKPSTNTSEGLISNIGNALEKIKRFSNEPAIQRSIPVMITLFVIFIGMVFFIITPMKTLRTLKLKNVLIYLIKIGKYLLLQRMKY